KYRRKGVKNVKLSELRQLAATLQSAQGGDLRQRLQAQILALGMDPDNIYQELADVQVKSGVKYAAEPAEVTPPEEPEKAQRLNAQLIEYNGHGGTSSLSEIAREGDVIAMSYLCRRGLSLKHLPPNCGIFAWHGAKPGSAHYQAMLENAVSFFNLMVEKEYHFKNNPFCATAVAHSMGPETFDRLLPVFRTAVKKAGIQNNEFRRFRESNPAGLTEEQLAILDEIVKGARMEHARHGAGERPGMNGRPPRGPQARPRPGMHGQPPEGGRPRPGMHGQPPRGGRPRPGMQGAPAQPPAQSAQETAAADKMTLQEILASGKAQEEKIRLLTDLKAREGKVTVSAGELQNAVFYPELFSFMVNELEVKTDAASMQEILTGNLRPNLVKDVVTLLNNLSQEEKDQLLAAMLDGYNPRRTPAVRALVISGANPDAEIEGGITIREAARRRDPRLERILQRTR
ncbi:MAG: hypothetical protein J6S21_07125, partial [Victivallales bacterium]|nr:hypothetical protein [Victivallales bacterium]